MTVVTPVYKGPQSHLAEQLLTIVIGWNLRDHFFPTEMASPKSVYNWKLALCHKFLGGAVDMFNEVESDLLEDEDTVLIDAM